MHEIPRHLTWMEQTAGGVFDRRNPLLKEVDDAILAYDRGGGSAALKDAIRLKLDAYLSDYKSRKMKEATGAGGGIRDRRGAITSLLKALTPVVLPPAIDQPIPPPRPIPSPPPPPATGRVKISDDFRRRLEANLGKHQRFVSDADVRTDRRNASLDRVSIAVTHGYASLVEVKGGVQSNLGHTFSRYNQALDKGMALFEAAYNKNSKAIDFKVSLMKGAFEALTYAPFPLSIIGKAGVGVMGQLKTEKMDIQKVEAPKLTGGDGLFDQAVGTITSAVANSKEKIRNLSVSPKNWKSRGEAQTNFEEFHRNLMVKFDEDWEKVKGRFEAGETEAQRLIDEQVRITASSTLNEFQARSVIRKIESETEAVKTQFRALASVGTATWSIDGVSKWIALLFVADYALNGLLKEKDPTTLDADTLGGESLSDHFAGVVEAAGFLEIKSSQDGRDTAGEIYAKGKIPWVPGGHITHLVAIYFFLHWARNNVNPFLCITRPEHLEEVNTQAKAFIRKLGTAIEAKKTSRMLRHATTDAAWVAESLTF